jgi:hypothetical protein
LPLVDVLTGVVVGVVEDDCEIMVLGRTMVETVEETVLRGDVTRVVDFVRNGKVVNNKGEAESEGVLVMTDIGTKREELNDPLQFP